MNTRLYDRNSALTYAKKWALVRNPKYYNFDSVGGDCTSFVSQCLFAGSKKMNTMVGTTTMVMTNYLSGVVLNSFTIF